MGAAWKRGRAAALVASRAGVPEPVGTTCAGERTGELSEARNASGVSLGVIVGVTAAIVVIAILFLVLFGNA